MRVRVWIDPNAPLIVGWMLRQDDEVMIWVEFRYEWVHKICKRCGIIGHSTTHYPHLNLNIERMVKEQMEHINRRFAFETGYDLQHILFTNNIRAFHSRGWRNTTNIETIRRQQPHQEFIEQHLEAPSHGTEFIPIVDNDEDNNETQMEDVEKKNTELIPQPQPLDVKFFKEV